MYSSQCFNHSDISFIAGNFPERICAPMAEEIARNGGEIRTSARLQEIVLNDDGSVKHYQMKDGSKIEGDLYVSAMPGKALSAMTDASL